MKKAISVFLAAAMILSMLSVGAYAANVDDSERLADVQNMIVQDLGQEKVTPELVKTVSHDQKLLEKAFLNQWAEISSVSSDGKVTYAIPYSDITEYITVEEDMEGNVVLNITDNQKNNELIYKKDGSILLDGNEVKVETSILYQKPNTVFSMPSQIIPRAGIYRQIYGAAHTFLANGVSSAPSGFAQTDYYFAQSTITYTEIIANLTVSVIASILIARFAGPVAAILDPAMTGSDVVTLLDTAIRFREIEFRAIAGQCLGKEINVSIYEYANTANNSLYSVFHYNFKYDFRDDIHKSAARYSFEAT